MNHMTNKSSRNEHENEGTVSLPGGYDVPFRTIQPEDASALQRFLERCSERTIYLRFFGSLEDLTRQKARYLAHVDGVDHFAFVALDPDHPNEIIASVRYDREPGEAQAEYAAIVEDSWHGEGLGIDLTRRLVDEAQDNEVRSFYALVMGKNRRMLELLRHLGLPEQERREDGNTKYVEVQLSTEEN